jgi:glycerol-3-phosphate acyltransferase PlsY
MLNIIFAVLVSYLIGSIPTSYIIAKLLKGIDIREYGSGNVGATNLMRTAGKVPGVIAFLLDTAKGAACVVLAAKLFYTPAIIISLPLFKIILGLCAVAGHIWTVFLGFKGGKGVAATIGVFLGLTPLVTLLGLLIWLIFAFIFRYVSLSSIAMVISLPILMYIFKRPVEYIIFSAIFGAVIIYTHRTNISRLLKGAEYKIGQKIKI